jgi:hypothetical protein
MLYSHGKGRYSEQYRELFEVLIPSRGPAKTLQGELLRAITLLAVECYENGNVTWQEDAEDHQPYVDLLRLCLLDLAVFGVWGVQQIALDLDTIQAMGEGRMEFDFRDSEDPYDRVTDRVVEWCKHHPGAFDLPPEYAPRR